MENPDGTGYEISAGYMSGSYDAQQQGYGYGFPPMPPMSGAMAHSTQPGGALNAAPPIQQVGGPPGSASGSNVSFNRVNPWDGDEDEDDEDDDGDRPRKRKQSASKTGDKTRRRINIEYITDKSKRHITFSKRKAGIMKKAYELSTLTGTDVLLLVVSESGWVYTFSSNNFKPLVEEAPDGSLSAGQRLIADCIANRSDDTPSMSMPPPTSSQSTSQETVPTISSTSTEAPSEYTTPQSAKREISGNKRVSGRRNVPIGINTNIPYIAYSGNGGMHTPMSAPVPFNDSSLSPMDGKRTSPISGRLDPFGGMGFNHDYSLQSPPLSAPPGSPRSFQYAQTQTQSVGGPPQLSLRHRHSITAASFPQLGSNPSGQVPSHRQDGGREAAHSAPLSAHQGYQYFGVGGNPMMGAAPFPSGMGGIDGDVNMDPFSGQS